MYNNNNNYSQKFPEKTYLLDFSKQFSKINLFLRKKAVLHTTVMRHYKPRQVLLDLFSNNQRNASQMTFAAVATKTNHQC